MDMTYEQVARSQALSEADALARSTVNNGNAVSVDEVMANAEKFLAFLCPPDYAPPEPSKEGSAPEPPIIRIQVREMGDRMRGMRFTEREAKELHDIINFGTRS